MCNIETILMPYNNAIDSIGFMILFIKYVVKHKSAKLFMTYAIGKLDAALNISYLIVKYKQSKS